MKIRTKQAKTRVMIVNGGVVNDVDSKRLSKRAKQKLAKNSPKSKFNASKSDPTGTFAMRKVFCDQLKRQFATLKGRLVKLLVEDDAFGLIDRQVVNCAPGQMRGADGRCGHGIGLDISRDEMPQIPNDKLDSFVRFARSKGIGVARDEMSADELQPVQSEFRQERVDTLHDDTLKQPLLVSQDGRILDGTHRWVKVRQRGDGNGIMRVLRIGLDVHDALDLMRSFDGAKFVENDNGKMRDMWRLRDRDFQEDILECGQRHLRSVHEPSVSSMSTETYQPFVCNDKVGWFPVGILNEECYPLIELPDIRQRDKYSCGAACCMSVGKHFGVGPDTLPEWKELFNTEETQSTSPRAILSTLGSLGLLTRAQERLTVDDLAETTAEGMPVICCVQYTDKEKEQRSNRNGHWIVVIGVGMGYVFAQDPSIDNIMDGGVQKPGRTMIAIGDFEKIWHNEDDTGKQWLQYGITVGPKHVENANPEGCNQYKECGGGKQDTSDKDKESNWLDEDQKEIGLKAIGQVGKWHVRYNISEANKSAPKHVYIDFIRVFSPEHYDKAMNELIEIARKNDAKEIQGHASGEARLRLFRNKGFEPTGEVIQGPKGIDKSTGKPYQNTYGIRLIVNANPEGCNQYKACEGGTRSVEMDHEAVKIRVVALKESREAIVASGKALDTYSGGGTVPNDIKAIIRANKELKKLASEDSVDFKRRAKVHYKAAMAHESVARKAQEEGLGLQDIEFRYDHKASQAHYAAQYSCERAARMLVNKAGMRKPIINVNPEGCNQHTDGVSEKWNGPLVPTLNAESGDNCGIGLEGFQPGNTCAKGGKHHELLSKHINDSHSLTKEEKTELKAAVLRSTTTKKMLQRVSVDDAKHERGEVIDLGPTAFTSSNLLKGSGADHISVKYSDDALYLIREPKRGLDVDYAKLTAKNFSAAAEKETVLAGKYRVAKVVKQDHPGRNSGHLKVYVLEEIETPTANVADPCRDDAGRFSPCGASGGGEKVSGESYFNESALKSARSQSHKSREKLVEMPVDDFLRLAEHLDVPSPSKQQTVKDVLDRGDKFETLPHLGFTHDGAGNAHVVSHEGRHRALALKELGVTHIPVNLISQSGGGGDSIRWGSQDNKYDKIRGEWPKRIHGQSGDSMVNFPVSVANAVFSQENVSNATKFSHHPDPVKLEAFQRWLRQQMSELVRGKSQEQLWYAYIKQGFAKGAGRAFDDVRKPYAKWYAEADKTTGVNDFHKGGKEEFLRSSFGQPVAKEKVELMASRSFDELENVTDEMDNKMSRLLTDGLIEGRSPHDVARDMADQVDISRARAELVAITETSRVHAEGQLTALELLGVEEVGVAVEWTNSGRTKCDELSPKQRKGSQCVCPKCAALEGVVMSIAEARGLLPLHPGCMCAWVPAGVGEDDTDQKRDKEEIDAALLEAGVEFKVGDERPEPIISNVEISPELLQFDDLFLNVNPDGCNQWTGPECSADAKSDSDTASHVKARDVMKSELSTTNLTVEQKQNYSKAVDHVISRMSERAAEAVANHVEKVEWHSNVNSLSVARVREAPPGSINPLEKVNGTYNFRTGLMRLDGETEKRNAPGMGISKGQSQRDIVGTYAHEMAHALDKSDGHSGKPEWKEAFREEILKGSADDPSLSRYARTDAREGFAEFGRALFGSDVSHSKLREEFPKCFAYFEKAGFVMAVLNELFTVGGYNEQTGEAWDGFLDDTPLANKGDEMSGGKGSDSGSDDLGEGQWITLGGSSGDSGDHVGGFPAFIRGDGTIVVGGPASLRGKNVSEVKEHFDKLNKETADGRRTGDKRASGQDAERPSKSGKGMGGTSVKSSDAKSGGSGTSEGQSVDPETAQAALAKVNDRIDRYAKVFEAKGNAEAAEWMGMLKEHVNEVGVEAVVAALGTEKAVKYAGKVQYEGAYDELDDFIKPYLEKSGITLVQSDTKVDPGKPLISSWSEKNIKAQGRPERERKEGNYIPTDQTLKDKLEESKALPGLEKTEDINKLVGKTVTHFTPDVIAKLDKEFGKNGWIVKSYGAEAYAGYGVFFPQRIKQIENDAKATIASARSELKEKGYKIAKDEQGNSIGLSKGKEVHRFGSPEYDKLPKTVQTLGKQVQQAAPSEKGARLPMSPEESLQGNYGISFHRDKDGVPIGVTNWDGKRHAFDSKSFAKLEEIDGGAVGYEISRAKEADEWRRQGFESDAKFLVQPAFKAVGVSDYDRAMGNTWETANEGRVHVITDPKTGKASAVPYATLAGRGDSLPVVFHSKETKAMEKAVEDAINKLPASERTGQLYAPDVVKTKDGWKVIELNPSAEGGGSDWLGRNPMVIDAVVSHVVGREPQHVQFVRDLLRKSGLEMPKEAYTEATPQSQPQPFQPSKTIKGETSVLDKPLHNSSSVVTDNAAEDQPRDELGRFAGVGSLGSINTVKHGSLKVQFTRQTTKRIDGPNIPLPNYKQKDEHSCSFVAALSVVHHFDKDVSAKEVLSVVRPTKSGGMDRKGLQNALKQLDVKSEYKKDLTLAKLKEHVKAGTPVMLTVLPKDWVADHWTVVQGFSGEGKDTRIHLSNYKSMSVEEFKKEWYDKGEGLILSKKQPESKEVRNAIIRRLLNDIVPYDEMRILVNVLTRHDKSEFVKLVAIKGQKG
jgi:hypothetical protein